MASVLTLAQAKTHLNLSAAVTTDDAELQTMIDAAEATLTQLVGPLQATATTERIRGGCALALRVVPAISLTSVTPVDGSALTLADLYLDTAASVVTYNSGASFSARYYTVVYSAGRTVSATTNADLLMAIKELVRHLWSTQRGSGTRPGGPPSDSFSNTVPGAAHALPFRVTELIAPHLSPGFA